MFSLLQKSLFAATGTLLLVGLMIPSALAQKKYGPGASDSEILIGQTMPYSGPASAYGTIGKVQAAYFNMINEQGGVNGRKIKLISLDDGYSAPRTVEQVRRLVEHDKVLLLFQTLGTASNSAIHKYVNGKQVPHLFVASGASKWADPKNYPWTIGFNLSYQVEGQIYAGYILKNKPNAKIGVLYQNDDYGKDVLSGFKSRLGDQAGKMIVSEVSYEVTDPTIDSQIVSLKGSGADTFINISTPKFAAQAIRKAYDTNWKPLHFLNNVSQSIGSVLTPAGLEKSVGLITTSYYKDPSDLQWKNDAGMKDWLSFMKKYYPEGSLNDATNVYGYLAAQLLVHVLKQCGDDLSRENVMAQVANLKDVSLPLLLPGIKLNTSPSDFVLFEQLRLARFDGKEWVLIGELIGR
ncbi:MAG: ABC transporter substrate-binding protein [Burkholderiales bacterium]|nr:ABC transporter substrate-binding protein [Burkholderiales bacterium]